VRILKKIRWKIANPLAILFRRILVEGCWPAIWKFHWICPIFKKGSIYCAANYRGVHLTTLLSKICERVVGSPVIDLLLTRNAFGLHQWAYTKKRSALDMLAYLVSFWILMICNGSLVGMYGADISGAFDHVDKDRMLARLASLGISHLI